MSSIILCIFQFWNISHLVENQIFIFFMVNFLNFGSICSIKVFNFIFCVVGDDNIRLQMVHFLWWMLVLFLWFVHFPKKSIMMWLAMIASKIFLWLLQDKTHFIRHSQSIFVVVDLLTFIVLSLNLFRKSKDLIYHGL